MGCLTHHILHQFVFINTLWSHFGGFFNYIIGVAGALMIIISLTSRRFNLFTEESVQETIIFRWVNVIGWLATLRHFGRAEVVMDSLKVLGGDRLFTWLAFALRACLRERLSLLHEVDTSLSVTFPWLGQWFVWAVRLTLFPLWKVGLTFRFRGQFIKICFNCLLLMIWLELDSATLA